MERLVKEFKSRNFSVSTIKNAHHGFDVDQPGKDSFRHRQAGAQEVIVASSKRWVLMHENNDDEKIRLKDLLKKLSKVDLVLVEGFKQERHPKIEVVRQVKDQRLIAENDKTIIALATDTNININKNSIKFKRHDRCSGLYRNYLEL